MSASPTTLFDAPIFGADGNVLISVENSVSFQWVPAPGNSYTSITPNAVGDMTVVTNRPSSAHGYVTFDGMTSSEAFQSVPTTGAFVFSWGGSIGLTWSQNAGSGFVTEDKGWTYDPATGVLNPRDMVVQFDSLHMLFSGTEATWNFSNGMGWPIDEDYGSWQLVPDIHNVDVFGGVGNDTILGGQGQERLFGGEGNDLIRAGIGDDLVYGGTGNDQLYAGIGKQTVMGGIGNDTIWGGSGAQLLIGGQGQDMIHGGSGPQTLIGGAGNDTLWGGSGSQSIEGGDGGDVLHAGSGNETLCAGTGPASFAFSIASGQDIITNFQAGRDIIEIAFGFGGLKLIHASDLGPHISADARGDAVLTVGSDFRLVLQHVAAASVETHTAAFIKLT